VATDWGMVYGILYLEETDNCGLMNDDYSSLNELFDI